MRGAALFLSWRTTAPHPRPSGPREEASLTADFSVKCPCCHPALCCCVASREAEVGPSLWAVIVVGMSSARQAEQQMWVPAPRAAGGALWMHFLRQKTKWCLKGGHVRSCSVLWSVQVNCVGNCLDNVLSSCLYHFCGPRSLQAFRDSWKYLCGTEKWNMIDVLGKLSARRGTLIVVSFLLCHCSRISWMWPSLQDRWHPSKSLPARCWWSQVFLGKELKSSSTQGMTGELPCHVGWEMHWLFLQLENHLGKGGFQTCVSLPERCCCPHACWGNPSVLRGSSSNRWERAQRWWWRVIPVHPVVLREG